MKKEEIIVLDDGEDTPFGPMAFCCAITFGPFRSF